MRRITDEELNKKINGLTRTYQNARRFFIKMYSKHVWSNEAVNDKDSHDTFRQVLVRMTKDSIDTETQLDNQKIFHTPFYLTKLKLKTLVARYNLSIKAIDESIKIFQDIIIQLKKLLENNKFSFADDVLFQQEISVAFQSMDTYFRENNQQDALLKFKTRTLRFQFAKKCSDNIFKLRGFFNYWSTPRADGTMLINHMQPTNRAEFNDAYNHTISALEKDLATNPADMKAAIHFGEANVLALKVQCATHPLSIWQQSLTTNKVVEQLDVPANLSLLDMRKYLNYASNTFKKYIDTSIKQLLRADPNMLRDDSELMTELVSLINQLLDILRVHVGTYLDWLLQKNVPEDFADQLRLTLLHLIETSTDVNEIFRFHHLDTPNTLAGEICAKLLPVSAAQDPAIVQLIRQGVTANTALLKDTKEKEFKEKTITADENAKFLVEWDEKENKRLEAIKSELQARPKPIADKKREEANRQNSRLHHYFTRAQYFSRNRHHHDEAVEMYGFAYEDAIKSNDLYSRLAALDGQLFVHGKSLSHKVKTANDTLTARIHAFKTMSKTQRENFVKLMREVKNELKELKKLHALYIAMTHQPSVDSNKEINEGIVTSKILIAELIKKIEADNRQTKDLFAEINDKLKKRRANFIRRKGLEAIKEIKNQVFTDEEIDEIGLEIFREMGEEKYRNGIKTFSKFTQENNMFESLAKDFVATQADFASLAAQYKTEENTNAPESTPLDYLFAEVKDVPGEQLLVGSNVAAFLADKDSHKKLNAHDVDFVSSCKDGQALIDLGFHHSIYRSGLYQRSTTLQVDLTPIRDTSDAGLLEDAKKRDFTICAVYLDKHGKTRDPLETGIDDIANCRLRMIGDPNVRLREDPVRALRAIRYIMAGYEPDQALIDALKSLAMPAEHHQAHLQAVARKHLTHLDSRQYVTLLHEYDLLDKLLGIKCKTNIDLALWKLEKRYNIQKLTKTKHSILFARTDENFSQLSSLAAENSRWTGYADKKNMKPERRLAMQALNLR